MGYTEALRCTLSADRCPDRVLRNGVETGDSTGVYRPGEAHGRSR